MTKPVEMHEEDPAVTRFRNYLRINTMQPDVNYDPAIDYLEEIGKEFGLECTRLEPIPKKPILIVTWKGSNPNLPSLFLNSHVDVVPVFPEHWTYDPFDAVKDESGKIFARGAQDMKCVGMQYLEAVRKLKEAGKKLERTIHMAFVPDEEIGADLGMRKFVHTEEFKKLNVGFGMDEGITSTNDTFNVYNGERNVWWIKVTCPGHPGHGSQFLPNTAGEKLRVMINQFLTFREEEKKRLEQDPSLTLGDVTTVNLSIIEGGVQPNVVPCELSATFDCRVTPLLPAKKWKEMLEEWRLKAGADVFYTFILADDFSNYTPLDEDNHWWKKFRSACDELNISVRPRILEAGTDARFVRQLGIPVLGFSPMNNTPILMHDHDEYLEEKTFLRGIEIYETILEKIAS